MSFHYLFNNGTQVDPLSISGANVPGFPVGETFRAQNASIDETHSFTPTLINVARFSFLRNKFLFGLASNHEPPSSLGFQYSPTLPIEAGPPFIEVYGYASVGNPITGPANDYQNTFSLTDSLAWVHGKHEFKFGGEIQRDQLNTLLGIASNGFFVFPPVVINDALADFEQGQPVVFLQGGGKCRGECAPGISTSMRRTVQGHPRLTLNLGCATNCPTPIVKSTTRMPCSSRAFSRMLQPTASLGLALSRRPWRCPAA